MTRLGFPIGSGRIDDNGASQSAANNVITDGQLYTLSLQPPHRL